MQLPTGSHIAVADGTQFQLFKNSFCCFFKLHANICFVNFNSNSFER